MQTKVIVVNVSACNLFSVWLLYKSIFLLAWLSSALTSKLDSAEILNTHSLNTFDNAEKNFQKLWELCGFSLRGSHLEILSKTFLTPIPA